MALDREAAAAGKGDSFASKTWSSQTSECSIDESIL